MTNDAHLVLDRITHRYGNVTALEEVSLGIADGELVTLLGPSGCGKTTLLRIIAGFVRPTEGSLLLQGRDLTRMPAHRRPVNMVFQRAALFPHLDVFENIAFGLRITGTPKDDVRTRVAEALRLVRLQGLERRRAHELSGGQLQRVALARALVNQPRVLLLDEPLAALDLRIRLEMEAELRRVHRETGATFVYVTHDQGEALALSDRVVVFDQGRVEQVGTPDEIYRRPATPFAARFVGDANLLPVGVIERNGARATVDLVGLRLVAPCEVELPPGPAWLVVRPEVVRLGDVTTATIRGVVRDVAFRGSGFACRLEVEGLTEPVKAELPAESGRRPTLGSAVGIEWDSEAVCLIARPPE
jgi:ABC-type Fe3+/spermidine/putrescine transport system ATPase subunit